MTGEAIINWATINSYKLQYILLFNYKLLLNRLWTQLCLMIRHVCPGAPIPSHVSGARGSQSGRQGMASPATALIRAVSWWMVGWWLVGGWLVVGWWLICGLLSLLIGWLMVDGCGWLRWLSWLIGWVLSSVHSWLAGWVGTATKWNTGLIIVVGDPGGNSSDGFFHVIETWYPLFMVSWFVDIWFLATQNLLKRYHNSGWLIGIVAYHDTSWCSQDRWSIREFLLEGSNNQSQNSIPLQVIQSIEVSQSTIVSPSLATTETWLHHHFTTRAPTWPKPREVWIFCSETKAYAEAETKAPERHAARQH